MLIKTLSRLAVEAPSLGEADPISLPLFISEKLEPKIKNPHPPGAEMSNGWMDSRNDGTGALVMPIGTDMVFWYCEEVAALPAEYVTRKVKAAVEAFTDTEGRPPSRQELTELRMTVRENLLQKAPTRRVTTPVVWVSSRKELWFGTASAPVMERAIKLLRDSGIEIHTNPVVSPAVVQAFMNDLARDTYVDTGYPAEPVLHFTGDIAFKGADGFSVAYQAAAGEDLEAIKEHTTDCRVVKIGATTDDVSFRVSDKAGISQVKCKDLFDEKADEYAPDSSDELLEAGLYVTLDILHGVVEAVQSAFDARDANYADI